MRLFTPLLLLLAACSSYQQDFRAAAAVLPQPPPNALGPWQGEWKSQHNGHHGPLWCLISPAHGKPNTHEFRYRAGWGWFKFGDYIHAVETTLQPDGSLNLSGKMELPGGIGTYAIEGKVTPTRFDARYTADNGDHGTMTLRRP